MPPRQGIGFAVFGLLAIGVNLGTFSCSAESPPPNRRYGNMPAGGAAGNGGPAGGAPGAGGALGAAGFSGAGPATGGTTNGAGGSPTGSGGGGQGGFGGSSGSSGGSTATGGSNTGGVANAGGSAGTGGNTGSGGSGGSPTCTDTPPPNGDTCAHAVEYGWCGQPWMNGACAASCRLCSGGTGGTSGGSSGRGGTGGASGTNGAGGTNGASGTNGAGGSGGSIPPITSGGQNGWLSRYWDCCKPACGWRDNAGGTPMRSCGVQNQSLSSFDTASSCPSPASDRAFMCWSGAPWQVSDTLAYGFVAASGTNYRCGRCYQIDFTGEGRDDASPQRIRGKSMIVQVINNGGVAGDQLDLLVPGGGVGDFPAACPMQWGAGVALGERYGGFRRTCGDNASCVRGMCEAAFGNKPDLMAGCNWFLGWYSNVNNPRIVFKQIACPAAITQRSGMPDRP